jgi:hypothetical protein
MRGAPAEVPAGGDSAAARHRPGSLRALQRQLGNGAIQRLAQASGREREAKRASVAWRIEPALAAAIAARRGQGSPLDPALRQEAERRLPGQDFSTVRCHVGDEAAQLGARAFASGEDLFFAAGEMRQPTVLHELRHVADQRAGRVRGPFGGALTVIDDPAHEAAAERAASSTVPSGLAPTATGAPAVAAAVVQRIGGAADYEQAKYNILDNPGIPGEVKRLLETGKLRVTRLAGANGEHAMLERADAPDDAFAFFRAMSREEFIHLSETGRMPKNDSYQGLIDNQAYAARYLNDNPYLVRFNSEADVWADIMERGGVQQKAEKGGLSIGIGATNSVRGPRRGEQLLDAADILNEHLARLDDFPGDPGLQWRLVQAKLPSGLYLQPD